MCEEDFEPDVPDLTVEDGPFEPPVLVPPDLLPPDFEVWDVWEPPW